MTRDAVVPGRQDSAGGDTPSKDDVEHDFSVPGDADLRPAEDEGASATTESS